MNGNQMITFMEQLLVLFNWIGLYLILNSLNKQGAFSLFGVLWISIFFFWAAFFRKKFEKLWVTAVSHVVLMITILLVYYFKLHLYAEAAFVGFCAIFVSSILGVNEWMKRYKKKPYETQPLIVVCPLIMYVYGVVNKDNRLMFYALIITIGTIVVNFLCKYLQGAQLFLNSNKGIEDLPEKAIRSSGGKIFASLVSITGIVMLFAGFFKFDNVFSVMGSWIIKGIIWVTALINWAINYVLSFFATEESQTNQEDIDKFLRELSENADNDPFINKIISAVAIILLTIIGVKLLLEFFERIDPDNFKNKVEVISKDWTEVRETIVDREISPEKYGNDEKGRIRRRYKNEVKKQLQDKVNNAMTTGEILKNASDERKILKNLTLEYNKVRYDK